MPTLLQQFLLNQLSQVKACTKEWHAAEFIILQLDDYGYLTLGVEELVEKAGSDLDTILESIRLVQSLSPAGVGAKDLQECLLLQLTRRSQTDSLEYRIIRDHMRELGRKHTPASLTAVANALEVELKAVMQAIERIRKLHPQPGRGFSSLELN